MRALVSWAVFPLIWLLVACKSAVPLPEKALALNSSGIEALGRGDLETADARFSLALEYSPEANGEGVRSAKLVSR